MIVGCFSTGWRCAARCLCSWTTEGSGGSCAACGPASSSTGGVPRWKKDSWSLSSFRRDALGLLPFTSSGEGDFEYAEAVIDDPPVVRSLSVELAVVDPVTWSAAVQFSCEGVRRVLIVDRTKCWPQWSIRATNCLLRQQIYFRHSKDGVAEYDDLDRISIRRAGVSHCLRNGRAGGCGARCNIFGGVQEKIHHEPLTHHSREMEAAASRANPRRSIRSCPSCRTSSPRWAKRFPNCVPRSREVPFRLDGQREARRDA